MEAKGRDNVCPPLLRRLTEDLQVLRQPPGPVRVSFSLQQTPALTMSCQAFTVCHFEYSGQMSATKVSLVALLGIS